MKTEDVATYEQFGAVGDGRHDDLPAIVKAHAHANAKGLPVRSRPDATYHLGRRALTAVIQTSTDWNTSRFIIDDRDVENHKKTLFRVTSGLEPVSLKITRLKRDQKRLDVSPGRDCFVRVENDGKRLYIRRGLNQNKGTPQHDAFIMRADGTIDTPIDWDYDKVTRVVAKPIDEKPLIINGGVFTTIANGMRQERGYNYWARNIAVTRSNTEILGLTHHVVDEPEFGHPYSGFITIRQCANVTLRDCFATGHRVYTTIGAAGKPVRMGSYDYAAHDVVNLRLLKCRMERIDDRSLWGVINSNFCKDILLEDCVLSRMDTHQGISGKYTIRRCTLGYMGINAIGRGLLTVEDSELHGPHLVSFRLDYGSTWQGDVVVRDCRWVPAAGGRTHPHIFGCRNDGMHDFGYRCFMPSNVVIDGLYIKDANTPDGYDGPYVFTDPDKVHDGVGGKPPKDPRPFPYEPCRSVTLRRVTTASGKGVRLCPNPRLAKHVAIKNDE